ncbi:MAG: AAA family ATPase, partial [Candidatus Dormibacteria bacterium]
TIEARAINAEDAGSLNAWLEWVASLPWGKLPPDEPLDMEKAAMTLNAAHRGDGRLKQLLLDRILGSSLLGDSPSQHRIRPVLLVGPPGSGKSSLALAVAAAMGRTCTSVSVPTAVRDGVYLSGCSRVYRGAEPGIIIRAVRSAATSRLVVVLDELDKVFSRSDFEGPSAASSLLELLDGQATWSDRYMGVEFDLSPAAFVGTANSLETIPGPLLDRFLVLEVPGLSPAEREATARSHIWPRLMEAYGLIEELVPLDADALHSLVVDWACPGETGLRGVESRLETVLLRAIWRGFNGLWPVPITRELIREALAPFAPRSKPKRLGFAAPDSSHPTAGPRPRVHESGPRGGG